jgi:hypothetical protein
LGLRSFPELYWNEYQLPLPINDVKGKIRQLLTCHRGVLGIRPVNQLVVWSMSALRWRVEQ